MMSIINHDRNADLLCAKYPEQKAISNVEDGFNYRIEILRAYPKIIGG
jgi:hypothetical protein